MEIFDWRKHLKVHPAADLLPLMSGAELKELAEDIRKSGLQCPVLIWRKRTGDQWEDFLIDGRNRLDALARLGWLGPKRARGHRERQDDYKRIDPLTVHYPDEAYQGLIPPGLNGDGAIEFHHGLNDDDDVYRCVVALNVHRRHLTAAQKRDLIATLLKRQPETSDRQIGATVKADHKTVAAVRSDMMQRGEIPHVKARTDSKGRKQPSSKPVPAPTSESVNGAPKYPSPPSAPTFDYDPADDPEIQPGNSREVIRRRGFLFRAAESAAMACVDKLDNLPIDNEMRAVAKAAADEWNAVVAKLPPQREAAFFGTVEETNQYHREIMGLLGKFQHRFRAWCGATDLTPDAKECLHNALMICANSLMDMAQEIDGR